MKEIDDKDSSFDLIRIWLETNCRMSSRLFLSGRTLADQQNPLFVGKDIELKTFEKYLETNDSIHKTSGFVSQSIVFFDEDACSDKSSTKIAVGKYLFLSNWEILWDYFQAEDSDEVAVQLPFLRTAMEFMFHRRIRQLVVLLFLWNFIIILILQGIYRKYITEAVFQTLWLNITFQFVVYLLICFMINGPESSFWRETTVNNSEESSGNPLNISTSSTQPPIDPVPVATSKIFHQNEVNGQVLSFQAAVRDLWQNSKIELHKLSFSRNSSVKNKYDSNSSKSISKSMDSFRTTKSKTSSLYYYRWFNIALKVLTRAYGVDLAQVGFKRQSYSFILLFIFIGYPIYVLIMFYLKIGTAITEECGQANRVAEVCHFYVIQLFASGFGFSMVAGQYFFGGAILLSLVGLAYGCEIAFRLAESWELKFHELRRIEVTNREHMNLLPNENDPDTRNPIRSQEYIKEQELSLSEHADALVDLITRDASEHYLLICALMRRAGDLWSPVLLLFVFLTLYISISNVVLITSVAHSLKTVDSSHWLILVIIFTAVRVIVLFLYPILNISFANSYFTRMYDIFRMADEDDYALIGGRDRWVNIFKDAPASWTVFGVSITPSRMFAVLWTALLALGGIIISKIVSSGSVMR